jgi:hypothetical protein
MKKAISIKEAAKVLKWNHTETKRTIHFDGEGYYPLLSDKTFSELLIRSMNRCGQTLNIYKKTPNNDWYNDAMKKRAAWIKQALDDPLLRESDKEFIQQIDARNKKRKSSQLWPELAEDLTPAFTYIIQKKYLNQTKARYFLLEALSKWFPDNAEVKTDAHNEFDMQEKLKKHLTR